MFLGFSIHESRERILNSYNNPQEKVDEEVLEEGFSPERSPTKKIKKKALLLEDKENDKEKEAEDEGIKGIWEGILRKFSGFCKC